MIHKGTQTLRTSRLILRRFTLDDARQVFDNWTSDSEVSRYARQQSHTSVDETTAYIDGIISSYSDNRSYYWAIALADSDMPIGRLNITGINEPIESVCVSFMTSREWWGKGYTTEALGAVVKFFFEEVGANRIEGRNDVNNPASGKVMMKCGFQYEGLLRQGGRNSYGLVDCRQYAIIADDYFGKESIKKGAYPRG